MNRGSDSQEGRSEEKLKGRGGRRKKRRKRSGRRRQCGNARG